MFIKHDKTIVLFSDILLSKMEEEQRRMQSSVFDALNEIDRKCLRNVQVNYLNIL